MLELKCPFTTREIICSEQACNGCDIRTARDAREDHKLAEGVRDCQNAIDSHADMNGLDD